MPESDIMASRDPSSFIKAAEIWLPDGDVLKSGGGNYGALDAFAKTSAQTVFAHGEGLPGKAWAEGRPVVLKEFDGSYFLRAQAATEAGLTCAVAIPVFSETTLKAVAVVFCGDADEQLGAIELWAEAGDRLRLDAGYYGAAQAFEEVSQTVAFAPGQGLPGGVWSAEMPVLMRAIGSHHGFVRGQSASEAGLKTGLGIPVPSPDDRTWIVTLLSGSQTPLARRFEIWDARPERVGPRRAAMLIDGICEREGPLWPKQNPPVDIVTVGAWQGPVGQVLGSGLPPIVGNGTGLPAGYRSMVALPVYRGEDLAFITAWYL